MWDSTASQAEARNKQQHSAHWHVSCWLPSFLGVPLISCHKIPGHTTAQCMWIQVQYYTQQLNAGRLWKARNLATAEKNRVCTCLMCYFFGGEQICCIYISSSRIICNSWKMFKTVSLPSTLVFVRRSQKNEKLVATDQIELNQHSCVSRLCNEVASNDQTFCIKFGTFLVKVGGGNDEHADRAAHGWVWQARHFHWPSHKLTLRQLKLLWPAQYKRVQMDQMVKYSRSWNNENRMK